MVRENYVGCQKVSKDEIINATVEVLRDGGFLSINARSVEKNWAVRHSRFMFPFEIWMS